MNTLQILVALALGAFVAVSASAADILLKDGRVLKNAVVIKQDHSSVTVRHTEGFSQVEKTKLPDELAAQYPVDAEGEAAALAQQAADANRREAEASKARNERILAAKAAAAEEAGAVQSKPRKTKFQWRTVRRGGVDYRVRTEVEVDDDAPVEDEAK